MLARRLSLALAAALGVSIVIPGTAVAIATVEELVAVARASPYFMQCSQDGPAWYCSAGATRTHPDWFAKVTPGSGQEQTLEMQVTTGQLPMDPTSRSWIIDLHVRACGDPQGVDTFVNDVGDLTETGQAGPIAIGTCTLSGELQAPQSTVPFYRIVSTFVPPPPTPRPTPSPTPVATAKPTLKPTTKPTPTAAPVATPRVTPSPSPAAASLGASPSPSLEPTGPPTSSSIPTGAPAAPTSTPAPGGTATAVPGPPATEAPTAPTPEPSFPAWTASVLAIQDLNSDGGAIGGSLLLALVLLLIVGFIGELFNNTVENNYDEIAGWFRKGPIGRLRRAVGGIRFDPPGRPGVLIFIGLTALISSFVDAGFGLNLRSIAVFLGFLVGLIVVLASFKLPPILARRRRTGELGQLRPLPWALVIAAVFVLTSRLAHLQPGYLYGIVLGAIFMTDVSDRDEGKETFYGSLWTLGAAVLAWIALTWLRGLGLPADGFGVTLLSTAFAATLVAGLEAAAFALMPLRFLPGYILYKWNRPVWAVLWAVSLFAFFHILIGPTSGYVSELSPQGFVAALGVFAAFGVLSVATWLYFRVRTARVAATE